MRLSNIAPACALSLILLGVPLTLAAGGPTANIVNASGSVLAKDGFVRVDYAGLSSGALGAEVRADGDLLATYAGSTSGNGTLFLRLNASGHASGTFAFVATVWDESGHVAESPPVDLALHDPPRLAVTSAYHSWNDGAVHVAGTAFDADASLGDVLVRVQNESTWASVAADGSWSATLPVNASARWSKNVTGPNATFMGNASVAASDGFSARASFTFSLADRPGEISVSSAQYERGGKLRLHLDFSDPDGVRFVTVTTPLGGQVFAFADIGGGHTEPAMPINARIGDYVGTATVTDAFGRNATTTFSFSVRPTHTVLYDQVVDTSLGALADSSPVDIPTSFNTTVRVCTTLACLPTQGSNLLSPTAMALHTLGGVLCSSTGENRVCSLGMLPAQTLTLERLVGYNGHLEVRIEADVL